ncbi:hypothetical protein RJ640_006404 [Escallonia rubra]|uniref:Uncharacterized protein n=1 Tax=Escallonia rubra TaxID=112253 RepID=A0AA88UM94_9ASTE|nr:hypothetical protein RJ640_006404 [Escallonia rubra]
MTSAIKKRKKGLKAKEKKKTMMGFYVLCARAQTGTQKTQLCSVMAVTLWYTPPATAHPSLMVYQMEELCIEYREGRKKGVIVAGFCKSHTDLWDKQQQTGKFKIVARDEHRN